MRVPLVGLGVAIGLIVVPVNAVAQRTRVLVCHIPPGNPSNAHAMSLPDSAVHAHLAHGDTFGRCDNGPVRGPRRDDGARTRGTEGQTQGGAGSERDRQQVQGGGNHGGRIERGDQRQTGGNNEQARPSGSGRNDNGPGQDQGSKPSGKGPHLDEGGNGGRGTGSGNNSGPKKKGV